MSKERRAFRRRKTSVNIKIQFICWIVELVAGWCLLIIRFLIDHDNKTLKMWMWFADTCLYFIIIPSTYVINNEVTKEVIILENWHEGARNALELRGKTELDMRSWYTRHKNAPPSAAGMLPGSTHQNRARRPPAAAVQHEHRPEESLELEDVADEENSAPADE